MSAIKVAVSLSLPQLHELHTLIVGRRLASEYASASERALWVKLAEAVSARLKGVWTCRVCGREGYGRATSEPGGGVSHQRCARGGVLPAEASR